MKNISVSIKNIIFDLGGVLLNIDHARTIDAFAKLGLPHPGQAFSKEIQSELFQDFECGKITSVDFLNRLTHHIPNASTAQIVDAWNAMLLDFPNERFELLKKLSGKYRLFVLSNTNSIHLKAFRTIIDKSVGWRNFEQLFDGIGYSHELNARKPNPDIFEKMMELYSLNPAETLFIDDTEVHVRTAKSLGIHAIHLDDGVEISEAFAEY